MISKKSDSANMEDKRMIFLEIGIIIALSLVFFAFNWKSYDKLVIDPPTNPFDNIPIELVPVTVQKPPEPKVKMPPVVHTIKIVDDKTDVDENYLINVDIDPTDTVPVYIPMPAMKEEENPAEEEIFKIVESMPEFPGGIAAMYDFLRKNMKYPKLANEAGISGKVYITFVVEKDGSITDVRVLRGIGGGCDEEALRVVNNMPDWKPGKQRNVPVRVQFILDVNFTLLQM